ncbi:MAG: DUF373 family protein [archaeon]
MVKKAKAPKVASEIKTKEVMPLKVAPLEQSEKILILSIDRDDDIGQKLGRAGPFIGFSNNLKLASDLAIKDPEESDANCIFAALRKYEQLKKNYDVEIATLTGYTKDNLFYADKNIADQLKLVLENFEASSVVFVTDGAEDDQVIPLIQNYLPIISKELVIVRQAKEIESIFYTIKKAINDPVFARIIFGVPAIIMLILLFAGPYGLKIVLFLCGMFLLIKGFNLESKLIKLFDSLKKKFSISHISFIFYIISFVLFIFTVISAVNLFLANGEFELILRLVYVIRAVLLYFVLSLISYFIGSLIDLFYYREMFKLGKIIFSLFSVLILSSVLDLSLQLLISEIKLSEFIFSAIIATIILFLFSRIISLFDITLDVSTLFIGLPVISKFGLWLGNVVEIDEPKHSIRYKDRVSGKLKIVSRKHFFFDNGKLIV